MHMDAAVGRSEGSRRGSLERHTARQAQHTADTHDRHSTRQAQYTTGKRAQVERAQAQKHRHTHDHTREQRRNPRVFLSSARLPPNNNTNLFPHKPLHTNARPRAYSAPQPQPPQPQPHVHPRVPLSCFLSYLRRGTPPPKLARVAAPPSNPAATTLSSEVRPCLHPCGHCNSRRRPPPCSVRERGSPPPAAAPSAPPGTRWSPPRTLCALPRPAEAPSSPRSCLRS